MRQKLRFLAQLALLTAIFWAGKGIALVSGIPIPGNVVGVVLLFGLLTTGIIKPEYVQNAADFLLRHLVFFFIPIAVDLMNWGAVFYRYGIELALAIVVSTLLTFLTTGCVTQLLQRRRQRCSR